MRLSLIGTYHVENGETTVSALERILEYFGPDTIFAEVPPCDAAAYADGSHRTLESIAVTRVRQHRELTIVPVDLERPGRDFFVAAEGMFQAVENASRDYKRLADWHRVARHRRGFPYLNSAASVERLLAIDTEVRNTVHQLRDPQVLEAHERWTAENERREAAMISRMQDYAEGGIGTFGILLVGAAHLGPLRARAQQHWSTRTASVTWDLESTFDPRL